MEKTRMDLKEAIKKLVEARKAYYAGGHPLMSDQEYDALEDWVRKQDPNHPILVKVGAEPSPAWQKAKHKIAMGSLDKVHTEEDFRKWASKFPPDTMFIAQMKLDGASLELEYDLDLQQAITRGDGEYGEDITPNVFKMQNVITNRMIGKMSIRGEILLPKESFEKINDILDDEDKYSNERNAASGISRRLDGMFCQYLTFVAYDLIETNISEELALPLLLPPDEISKVKILSDSGFKTPTTYSGGVDAMVGAFARFKAQRESLPFGMDGVVIKVNSSEIQKSMGSLNGRPKAQIAWKFDPPGAMTKFLHETWEIGRTGVITPLAHLEPVEIDGSTISKATLHNIAEIKRLGIGRGDTVMIVKRGDIIPKVESVIEHYFQPIIIPNKCPSCGEPLDNDGIKLICMNGLCSARNFYRIMNWIKVVTIDGLGESLLDRLFNDKKVREIADLYKLTVGDIASLEGWGDKSATAIINNINNTRRLDPEKFLAAIGIPGISYRTAEDLIEAFSLVEGVLGATKDQISALHGYSDISATEIVDGLRIYGDEIRRLMKIIDLSPAGVHISEAGKLSGKTFCFTGAMARPRPEYQKMVEKSGGKNLSSVTKDLSYLVCNSDQGSNKSIKAKKYGIPVISEQEFLLMVEDLEIQNKSGIESVSLF